MIYEIKKLLFTNFLYNVVQSGKVLTYSSFHDSKQDLIWLEEKIFFIISRTF